MAVEFAVESVGHLLMNISLFSAGMAFGIIGIVLGVMRSTTKNNEHWAILFSAVAWAIALIGSNVWYMPLVFGAGAVGMSLAFMPIIKKMGDANIIALAIVAAVMNLLILTGTGAYSQSLDWQSNWAEAEDSLENVFGGVTNNLFNAIPDFVLCGPNQIDEDGEPCQSDVMRGSFKEDLFVPLASIITIATYVGKFLAFIGMVTLAPVVLGNVLATSGVFNNTIVLLLMSLFVTFWQMAIFYKLVMFVLDKRGMK